MNGYIVRTTAGTLCLADTYDAALAVCKSKWPSAEIGHSGDLRDGGTRTLVWACPDDAENDDGYKACAEIVKCEN